MMAEADKYDKLSRQTPGGVRKQAAVKRCMNCDEKTEHVYDELEGTHLCTECEL